MKRLILFITIIISFTSFSQKTVKDTNEICMPYTVAKKIALDLNKLDSITKISKLTDFELLETRKKVVLKDSIINTFEQKEKNYKLELQKENEKFIIIEKQNDDLRKEVKKLKTKNTFIEIIGSALLTTLTVLSIVK